MVDEEEPKYTYSFLKYFYIPNYSLMYKYTISVLLLALPVMFSARVKRAITDVEAVTVDKMIEVRYIY